MTRRCPEGHGCGSGRCLQAGIRERSQRAHPLKPLPLSAAQGREGPFLWVQVAQAPLCCRSGEAQSHCHHPTMLRTLVRALLVLVTAVGPSQASGFTGEGSRLCAGMPEGRWAGSGSLEDGSPAESWAGKDAPALRGRVCPFLAILFHNHKRGGGNASESPGAWWGSSVDSESVGLGGARNSAFLPVVQMLQARWPR